MIVLRLTLKVLMITSRWITFAFARRLVAIRSWNSHLTLLLRQRHQRAIIRTKEAFMIWVFSPPLLLWSRTFWLLRFENKTSWWATSHVASCHYCQDKSMLQCVMILMTNGKKCFWNFHLEKQFFFISIFSLDVFHVTKQFFFSSFSLLLMFSYNLMFFFSCKEMFFFNMKRHFFIFF